MEHQHYEAIIRDEWFPSKKLNHVCSRCRRHYPCYNGIEHELIDTNDMCDTCYSALKFIREVLI